MSIDKNVKLAKSSKRGVVVHVAKDGSFEKSFVMHPEAQPHQVIIGSYRTAKEEGLTAEQRRHIKDLKNDEVFFDGTLHDLKRHLENKPDPVSKVGAEVLKVAIERIPALDLRPPLQRDR